MKTETVEEFLARGGKVHQSSSQVSLDALLFNEGLLGKDEVDSVKKNLDETMTKFLSKDFAETNTKEKK